MSENLSGIEASAVKLLKRAIELEQASKFQPSLVCYQEGIDLLFQVLKGCGNAERKKHYRDKIEEYMSRAESLKQTVETLKSTGKFHVQVRIEDDATGHSYLSIFRPYLDDHVTEVWVEDAYVRSFHQVNNFLRFCEMLLAHCPAFRAINLTTTPCPQQHQQQADNLDTVKRSLSRDRRGVVMRVEYVASLHDREIRLNTGWIVKIGRGLDFFKRVDKLCVGFYEQGLRPCHATTVDVFHSQHTRQVEQR